MARAWTARLDQSKGPGRQGLKIKPERGVQKKGERQNHGREGWPNPNKERERERDIVNAVKRRDLEMKSEIIIGGPAFGT